MHQDIGALRELRELRGIRCVAGDHNRSIWRVESVSVRLLDRWVSHFRRADLYLIVFKNHSWLIKFMRRQKLARISAAFIDNARVDVELLVVEKIFRHLPESRW